MDKQTIVAILAKRINDEKNKSDGMKIEQVPVEYREDVKKIIVCTADA